MLKICHFFVTCSLNKTKCTTCYQFSIDFKTHVYFLLSQTESQAPYHGKITNIRPLLLLQEESLRGGTLYC